MRIRTTLLAGLALVSTFPIRATDHNNLDAKRPLRFEDAESIKYRELAAEFGLGFGRFSGKPLNLQSEASLLYGLAWNTQISLEASSVAGGRPVGDETAFRAHDVALGILHNFNRETESLPAFALRVDALASTLPGPKGLGYRVRGILSKTVNQYDRFHLNLDMEQAPDREDGIRRLQPGLVLGYSTPMGYPRAFNRTLLAELSVKAGPIQGAGPTVSAGLGYRQQITPRAVLDVGILSDLSTGRGVEKDRLRAVVGYSVSF
jgi:hypothetical protein